MRRRAGRIPGCDGDTVADRRSDGHCDSIAEPDANGCSYGHRITNRQPIAATNG
jgi:hypothetical protein